MTNHDRAFRYFPLELPTLGFDDPLTDMVVELEKLRDRVLVGTTHPLVFSQIKDMFHLMESVGSARIEGNNTTVAEYIETKIEKPSLFDQPASISEITNVERAMCFVEEYFAPGSPAPINKAFISNIHKLVVADLSVAQEGDSTPGHYRTSPRAIRGSEHTLPDAWQVDELMEELVRFINQEHPSKYDLIKAAVAHHRFVWIHPFGNGNGRVVRVLTYAMLLRTILGQGGQRIINPTAVFCIDRDKYYDHLSAADSGDNEGVLQWCRYVLGGLHGEIEKVDRLGDYAYLRDEILHPALTDAVQNRYITPRDGQILGRAIDAPDQMIKAADIKDLFPGKAASEVSRQLNRMREERLLRSETPTGRKYVLSFANNYIYRSMIRVLGKKGFLPIQ